MYQRCELESLLREEHKTLTLLDWIFRRLYINIYIPFSDLFWTVYAYGVRFIYYIFACTLWFPNSFIRDLYNRYVYAIFRFWYIYVTFFPVPYGSSTVSSEICITGTCMYTTCITRKRYEHRVSPNRISNKEMGRVYKKKQRSLHKGRKKNKEQSLGYWGNHFLWRNYQILSEYKTKQLVYIHVPTCS